ncbi:type IV-A pilus assembly ATPase PilB [Legionella maceachernii]|uniref:Pilus assembly protein PilB n=1 Tax=Legionella maceachernii TaxID=466 RepID=A0A0W0W185_9GAMM|nr:type IV-A pilus assembly ATPase PilB [Legionella maceachernii]KTD26155.1 pilus assembly protein PilB [Legionella maceachernii]SJZ71469.1 type IV pilus assembly protein PilB [Legionella maceachernii]SUP02368.1 Type II traffic warden ATPase [Legionella maceachernii]
MDMATIADQRLHGIAQLIADKRLISKSKILEYQHLALTNQQTLLEYLTTHDVIEISAFAQIVAEYFDLPFMDLDCIDFNAIPLHLINEPLIRSHAVLPIFIRTEYLFLATDDPSKQSVFKEIQFQTGLPTKVVVVETNKLHKLIDRVLNKKENQYLLDYLGHSIELENSLPANSNLDFSTHDCEAPVVKFINQIFLAAIKKGASDIHFEPYEQTYRIRYRQDGLLIEVTAPPIHLANQISTRIKALANLDISERRMPQDGQFQINFTPHDPVDCRVSTCPTLYGEKLVVRILNTDLTRLKIDSLGLNPLQKECFLSALRKPQGLILVTGPTGSGKTLSLYTALHFLNSKEKNISTIEDPVEIKIPGINQVNINPKSGLTFSTILRAFLRQDPDIIMVGEIRDVETAEIATKAAQTGHLVLSTLHANNAAEILTRLINLGVPAFNIAHSALLFIAQRLVRRLCNRCKTRPTNPTQQDLSQLSLHSEEIVNLYQANGCEYCMNGYWGRLGLFEVMPISPKLRQQIAAGANSFEIQKQAQIEGMLSIYQSGLEKVKQGLTTIEEINRVIGD